MNRLTVVVELVKALAFALAIASMSCKPKPTIVLDGWWLIDYARNACASVNASVRSGQADLIPSAKIAACAGDPVSEARQFEYELAAEFAANPLCHNLRFDSFDFPNPKAASEMKDSSNWTLMVNFEPGKDTQSWNVSRGLEASMYVEGTDNLKQIAAKVCAVVNQRGAELLK